MTKLPTRTRKPIQSSYQGRPLSLARVNGVDLRRAQSRKGAAPKRRARRNRLGTDSIPGPLAKPLSIIFTACGSFWSMSAPSIRVADAAEGSGQSSPARYWLPETSAVRPEHGLPIAYAAPHTSSKRINPHR